MKEIEKRQVIELLMGYETRDPSSLAVIHPTGFVQHSQNTGDGIEGMKKLFSELPKGIKVEVKRILQDEDYVFAHVETISEQTLISFHIFRFQDGLIVEHWDNTQEKQPLNLSNRSMIDGVTQVLDLEKTQINKLMARQLVDDVFFEGKIERLGSYFNGNAYIQHNPWLSDEISSIQKVINDWVRTEKIMDYQKVHLTLGQGNFVLLVSEGYFHSIHTSFYDLFRLENGKIAEHWDNFESIVPYGLAKNSSGKY
jgi:predicted SnoaL-like aldol condensation-catalyzing enzyme